MDKRQSIAIGIALQTQVLKTCPVHQHLYLDDDVDPASAFALAVKLVRQHEPCVEPFDGDVHALTDLLSDTLGATPVGCSECRVPHAADVASIRTEQQVSSSNQCAP